MKIRLLKYDIDLQFLPGKYLYIADLLSRCYDKEEKSTEIEYLEDMVHSINVSDAKKLLFKNETEKDSILNKLKLILINGWPNNKKYLLHELKFYWKLD